MMLDGDVMSEIFGRVEGSTLAMAACTCREMSRLCRDEHLWENSCKRLWHSTSDALFNSFISSSFGGFRRFYAHCFPCVIDDPPHHPKEMMEGGWKADDFVWAVDVRFGEDVLLSKVMWGVVGLLGDESMVSWALQSPFSINLSSHQSESESTTVLQSKTPTPSSESRTTATRMADMWRRRKELMEKMRVSWILINTHTREGVNLSTPTWSPSEVQALCSSCNAEEDQQQFKVIMRSVISLMDSEKRNTCVESVIEMRCRAMEEESSDEGDKMKTKMKMEVREVGIHLERGRIHLNGRESLAVFRAITSWMKRTRTVSIHHAVQRQKELRRMVEGIEGGFYSEVVENVASVIAVLVLLGLWCWLFCRSSFFFWWPFK